MKLTSAKHEFLADDVESLVLEKKEAKVNRS